MLWLAGYGLTPVYHVRPKSESALSIAAVVFLGGTKSEPRLERENTGCLPATNRIIQKPGHVSTESAPATNRQFIGKAADRTMPDILITRPPLQGEIRRILTATAIAAGIGVVDRLRPSVVCQEGQAARETFFQGYLKRVIVRISGVGSKVTVAELWIKPSRADAARAGNRIVEGHITVEPGPFIAHVGYL